MKKDNLKEEAEKLMNLEGRVRGIGIKGEGEFILKNKGRDALEKLEYHMERLGCPVKYEKLRYLNFYPLKQEAVTYLVLKEVFNFSDDNFRKVGEFESKVSMMVRMFMKYYFSIDLMAKDAPKIWRKYYSVGKMTVSEIDKEKHAVIKIEDFRLHPCFCRTLEGYFASIVKMMVKNPVTCEERKCVYKGDDYHEFLLKW